MPLAELRHVRQQYLKPYSSSDARLLPANGVVVRVHRQGAQLSAGATMFPETERDLTVRNTGGIRPDDTVQLGTDANRQLRVVSVTNGRKVRCVNDGPNSFSVAAGERLVPLDLAPTYLDSVGAQATPSAGLVTTDALGLLSFYCFEPRVDLYVQSGTSNSPVVLDVEAGWTQPVLPWLSAADFTSIQDAIDALPEDAGGTVHVPAGEWPLAETLVLPANKRVHLAGAGMGRTVLRSTDPAMDLLWIKGDGCTIEELAIIGPGSAAESQSETAGRGVVVGRLGAEATSPLTELTMRNVLVKDTASWALYLVGWDDTDGVPGHSMSILGRFERCRFEANVTRGLLKIRQGNTTQFFDQCSFLGSTGHSARLDKMEGASFVECVFEDSDDSTPYLEATYSTNLRVGHCWFEHHGGRGAAHDSNVHPFAWVHLYCRSVRFDHSHFVRNDFAAGAHATIATPALVIGDPTLEFGPTIGTSIEACDFKLPGAPTEDAIIRAHSQSQLHVVGGLLIGIAEENNELVMLEGNPGVEFLDVPAPGGGVLRHGSTRVTLHDVGARLRLSHSTATERDSAHLGVTWQPGDLTFDAAQQRAYLYTSSGWRQLAITT